MKIDYYVEKWDKEFEPIFNRIVNHPYVIDVSDGKLPREKLVHLVKDQYFIVAGDLRNEIATAARAPQLWVQDFFREMANAERTALNNLLRIAKVLGLKEKDLEYNAPSPGTLAFTNFFGRLANYGTAGEVASEMLFTFPPFAPNCKKIFHGLKKHYGFKEKDLAFFNIWGTPDYPIIRRKFMDIMSLYLDEHNLKKMWVAGKLGLEYEAIFWDTVYGEESPFQK